jgi:hypothetical protein
MMAMGLNAENVRYILSGILNECDFYGKEGKEAEHIVSYTSGVLDMANAVIEAIERLNGQ